MHVGLLLLRLVVGAVMAAHGGQKLFGWFGGPGLQRTGGFMESLGFRPGPPHAALLGCTELGSGVLLAAGLLTPLGAAAVVGVMVAAVATVHWPNGFFAGDGGYEFNLVLGAAALLVAFTGPGDWSVDHVANSPTGHEGARKVGAPSGSGRGAYFATADRAFTCPCPLNELKPVPPIL